MRLDYHRPGTALLPYLTVHATVSEVVDVTVAVLPAMLPNIHIVFGGNCRYVLPDGDVNVADSVCLVGPTDVSFQMVLDPGIRIAAVGLLPLGWASLIGIRASDLANKVVDLGAIWGGAIAGELGDRLASSVLDGRHVECVEAVLLRQMRHADVRQLRQLSAVDHWIEQLSSSSVDQLAGLLDVGPRQVRRCTLELYGSSPKSLAMKYRALRVAASLATGSRTQQAIISCAVGYADQPHLIRDFQRFVGWTPRAFAREQRSLTASTLIGRRRVGAVRPLCLLS